LIVVLVAVVIVNLSLTLWLLKVMQFSSVRLQNPSRRANSSPPNQICSQPARDYFISRLSACRANFALFPIN